MSYKLALHVLATFTEQVVPFHKHITSLKQNSRNETNAKAAVNNVPSQLRNCAVPPDHLCNEISFSRTHKIQKF